MVGPGMGFIKNQCFKRSSKDLCITMKGYSSSTYQGTSSVCKSRL